MPRYTYIAYDARGQESTGLVEAATTNDAIGELRRAGYSPTHVYEEGSVAVAQPKAKRQKKVKEPRAAGKPRGGVNIVLFQKKTVKPKVLMIFTRQLATLIDAGLPLLRGLNVL
ncbi:MAG TPA: type II secretion system F family protein, partial [Chthoniobacterales bacterium]